MAKPMASKLADGYKTYPTASAAAVAALRGITEKNYERGGGILYNKKQNAYAATEPTGQNDGSHFAAAVSVPQGWTLHSTYHTHPSGDDSTKFSDDDINTAKQLKAPSFVLARDDNKVRMFDPATSKTQTNNSRGLSNMKFSTGSLIDETSLAPPIPSTAAAQSPTSTAAPAPAPLANNATDVSVKGSRATVMAKFADQHRTQKYKHKIINVRKGAIRSP